MTNPCLAALGVLIVFITLMYHIGKMSEANHSSGGQYIGDAVNVLCQLGYSKLDATSRVHQVLRKNRKATLDEIVNAAIRL